jgi:formate hydrogenlyase subunit 6/NADH:ubiquinone oxidoreductase subunit I
VAKGANNTYFGNIKEGIKSSLKGLSLSWRHLQEARQSRKPIFVNNPDYFKQETGIVTLQYPHEKLPLPDNGRYQLHNEMDDCIVCDKCAKVCPVDCIEIEPIKATGIAGYASDGSAIRLYAAKFDIDMAKCCFCGLCTTVCPTECLTMTHEYDFSVFDVTKHNFAFGNLSSEQAQEKRDLYDQFMLEKEAMKGLKTKKTEVSGLEDLGLKDVGQDVKKPAFKPAFKKKESGLEDEGIKDERYQELKTEEVNPAPKPKPVFKPSFKKKEEGLEESGLEDKKTEEVKTEEVNLAPKPKPVFKPSFKKKEEGLVDTKTEEIKTEEVNPAPKPKPVFKPSFKKKEERLEESGLEDKKTEEVNPIPKPKPVFKPTFKKKETGLEETESEKKKVEEVTAVEAVLIEKPKPAFKPTFKPKPKTEL